MRFKRSAGLFVTGISLLIGGPLLSWAASFFGVYFATSGRDTGMAAISIAVVVFGLLLAVVGFFMLIVAIHRALVKIDALPVLTQPSQRQYSASEY